MPDGTYALLALYDALDEKRRSREMSWAAVALEVNHFHKGARAIAASTISGLKDKAQAEGDGILQMLLWIGRTPESFVPGVDEPEAERFRLREPGDGQVLRWNTKSLYRALDARREARAITWKEAALDIGEFTPGMLTNLSKGGRIGFPRVMRLIRWLGEPAAIFTHASDG